MRKVLPGCLSLLLGLLLLAGCDWSTAPPPSADSPTPPSRQATATTGAGVPAAATPTPGAATGAPTVAALTPTAGQPGTAPPLAVVTYVPPDIPGSQGAPSDQRPADVRILLGHTAGVTNLAWAPDGRLLASAAGDLAAQGPTADSGVRLWRDDGRLAGVLTGHTGPVVALAWAPDSTLLATGSRDGTIRLWRPDGSLVRVLDPQAGTVFALAWAPDGQTLASGEIVTFPNPTVHLWRPDGTLLRTLGTDGSGGKFFDLAWSPDGRWLVGGATDYKLWRADGSEVAHLLGGTPAWGLAWAPDSTRWAIGDESGTIDIYDVTGHLIKRLYNGMGNVDTLAWSPDGTLLAGGNGAYLWRDDGTPVGSHPALSARAHSLAWAPSGRMYVTGEDNGRVGLWGATGHALGALPGHTGAVNKVAWSPDGTTLASAADDTTIRLWQWTPAP